MDWKIWELFQDKIWINYWKGLGNKVQIPIPYSWLLLSWLARPNQSANQKIDSHSFEFLASPLSLTPELASTTLLITSTTLSSISTVSLPSPSDPSESLSLSPEQFQKIISQLESEGAATKQVEFVVKGAEPYVLLIPTSQPSFHFSREKTKEEFLWERNSPAPVVKQVKKPAAEEKKVVPGELDGQSGVQLGITVKKEQANFGEWYQQVRNPFP